MTLPDLTLVIGGAKSGKSSFAETLIRQTARPRHYIATAEAWDAEMRARIDQHQQDRGADWHTHEQPRHLRPVLSQIPASDIVLIDCATLWLTNHLLADANIATETAELLAAMAHCRAPVVVVSNEVGWSIVPDNALARAFRDHQGQLNQRLAAAAGLVVTVIAGLPIVLKGTLPRASR